MPNPILPRRSFTANAVPVPSTDISAAGELLINWADKVAYTKDSSGNLITAPLGGGGGGDSLLRSLFVPPAPTNLTATAGNAQVALSWTAPTVLTQTPITDYVVQYSANSGSTWTTFSDGTSTATNAAVTGLTNGTAYTFRVAAVNGVGTGAYTAASSSVTPSAATPAGPLFAAGFDDNNRLGVAQNQSAFAQIGSANWRSVSTGGTGGHAIRNDGTLWGWGYNDYGYVGDGTTSARAAPVQIGTDTWSQVSHGNNSAVHAIRSDGKLFAWGYNSLGQCGFGDTSWRQSPAQVGSDNWLSVASGGEHTLAIRADGKLFATGNNNAGQLGDGTGEGRSSFTQIGTDNWTAVAAGGRTSLAIRSDGKLFAWGLNTGDGTAEPRLSPVQLSTANWVAVSVSAFHTNAFCAAIRADGKLFTWGSNGSGQLGNGSVDPFTITLSPTQVGTSDWTAVDCGFNNTIAIRSDGKLFVWGAGDRYQLANGSTANVGSPLQYGTDNWFYATAGDQCFHAIRVAS